MKAILKKDIVIKAGTVFHDAPLAVERGKKIWGEHIFGLSNDSYGSVTYCMEPDDEVLKEWFDVGHSALK